MDKNLIGEGLFLLKDIVDVTICGSNGKKERNRKKNQTVRQL